ncbi:MAG: hypothetical protein U0Q16_37985 [Bryobacteraceae bacterium]
MATEQTRVVPKSRFEEQVQAAGARNRAAAEESVRLGVTDSTGNLLREDLPKDMQDGTGLETAVRANAPRFDAHLLAAGERARAAADEAERLGITDNKGNLLRTDLPKDMQEGADRDFGG